MGLLEDAIRAYATYEDRATDPATPGSGQTLVYVKDGKLHTVDDAGAVTEYGTGAPGGGGGGALTLIEEQTLASAGTFTFSSIPDSYNDLVLACRIRDASSESTVSATRVQVGNGTVDTGNNYDFLVYRYRPAGSADDDTRQTSFWNVSRSTVANNETAGLFTPLEVTIFDYADAATWRQFLAFSGALQPSQSVGQSRLSWSSGAWRNTADVIDTLTVAGDTGGNLVAGSRVRLYGRS